MKLKRDPHGEPLTDERERVGPTARAILPERSEGPIVSRTASPPPASAGESVIPRKRSDSEQREESYPNGARVLP
jgi:hypothetical protein